MVAETWDLFRFLRATSQARGQQSWDLLLYCVAMIVPSCEAVWHGPACSETLSVLPPLGMERDVRSSELALTT